MLTNLQNKITALQSFSFEKELIRVVTENKDKLADLQAAQLAQGINSKGQRIYPEYSPFTIAQKRGKPGLAGVTDRVTFFNTGELYRKLRAEIAGSRFSIKADTFKFDKMLKRSGVDTIGLDRDSREDFALEIVRPGVLDEYDRRVRRV